MAKLTTAEKAKDARLRLVYNTTLEEQNAKRAEQKNACAICRRPFTQYQAFNDHDHKCCSRHRKESLNRFCGKCNRGLLCFLCNKKYVPMIERMIKDGVDPSIVKDYIIQWRNTIKMKGGYAQEEVQKGKLQRKQKGIRRRPARNAPDGATAAIPQSCGQSRRSGRITQPGKAESGGVLE